jgi:hypothetical protein
VPAHVERHGNEPRVSGALSSRTGPSQLDVVTRLTDVRNGGCVDPFVSAEFVTRVAVMVDYFLDKMLGPQVHSFVPPIPSARADNVCEPAQVAQLKVENRERYNFEPKELLKRIVRFFINLATKVRSACPAPV